MRIKEGDIPAELLTVNASNDMLLFTAFISFLTGILFYVLGKKGKQLWMWTWGIGLALFSVFLGLCVLYEINLADYLR